MGKRNGAAEHAGAIAERDELDAVLPGVAHDGGHLVRRSGPYREARHHAGEPAGAGAEIGEGQAVMSVGAPVFVAGQHVVAADQRGEGLHQPRIGARRVGAFSFGDIGLGGGWTGHEHLFGREARRCDPLRAPMLASSHRCFRS